VTRAGGPVVVETVLATRKLPAGSGAVLETVGDLAHSSAGGVDEASATGGAPAFPPGYETQAAEARPADLSSG
jgi:hypothetical protein